MPLRSCVLLLAALLVATPLSSQTQKRPDFSGTWVAISPGDEGQATIKQSATMLEISLHLGGGPERRLVYYLDGSESRNQHEVDGRTIVTVSRASWKGEQLSLTSSTTLPDGGKTDTVDTWSFDGKGNLVIQGAEKMTAADGTPDGTGKLHLVLRRKSE